MASVITRKFVTKCNKLARSFEGLDRGDVEVELNKIQKNSQEEYEFVITALLIGMSIGSVELLEQAA